ncbi:hypothetical protein PHET_00149 [Paragonimus heterotremus]|uniref:Uncharacterized protein n=1 Tax=Paragonimus heterotremus TaxID=100268 RepID=A0A8J4WK36_9TREM|nr:hypothetical protein PHET_00149 [Paragonimus heterotremus]
MGRFTRIKTQNWTTNTCSGELVDIGFPCDEKILFCRSKNAVCRPLHPTQFTQSSQSNIWPKHTEEISEQVHHSNDISVCQCKENTVSVYQKTLDYFECFPKLTHVAAECDACAQRNGECYDLNGDGVGDGCKCPSDRSTVTSRKESAENICAQMHAFINCNNGSLSVCYLPHSVEPHNTLGSDISSGLAEVRLVPSVYSVWSAQNTLRSIAKDDIQSSLGDINEAFLQMQSVLNLYPKSPPASIKSLDPCELRNAYLAPSVSRDLLDIWFGQMTLLERHPANISPYCLYSDVWSLQRLCGLRINNIGKNAVQYEALLEVSVNRSFHTPNRDIRIPLKCVASSTKQATSHDSGLEISLGRNHLPLKTYLIGRKLVDLRVINEVNKEIYTADEGARIRLDALLADETGSINNPTVPGNTYGDSEFADLGFATLTSPLANSNILRCHYALCLNTAHIIWISTVLLSLLILVCSIFFGVYRRYRLLKGKIKMQISHQPTISSTSTCCHEILSKVDWSTLSCNTYHQNSESLDKNSPSVCVVPIADQYKVDTVNRSPMVPPVFASEQFDTGYLQTNRLVTCSSAPIKTVWNCGASLQDGNGYNSTNIAVNRKTTPNSGNCCYCDQLKPVMNSRHAECHSVTPLQFTDHNKNGSIEQPQAFENLDTKYSARIHSALTNNPESAEYHSFDSHLCTHNPSDVRMEDAIAVIPEAYFTRGSGSIFLGSNTSKPKSVILNCTQSDDLILLNNCGAATNDSFATVKPMHR